MALESLTTNKAQPELAEWARIIGAGRYFRSLAPEILENILKHGTLVELDKDSYLIREGTDGPQEMYLLLEGSLAVMTGNKFILRLDLPGDVVGEVGVIQSAPRSADVVAETDCRLVMFPASLFAIDEKSQYASILYVLFAHIMAVKLRYTTAQSLIRKNQRVAARNEIKIGVIDADPEDRGIIRAAAAKSWPDACVVEIDDPHLFVDHPTTHRFDYIVADPAVFGELQDSRYAISSFIKAMQLHGAEVLVLSAACSEPSYRHYLIEQGVDDMKAKPCTTSDLQHVISKFRIWYYKNLELDEVENAAETDRLTGLANRRRLDEFLEALITVYPESGTPFSLIISDVDNFKNYNDSQGHQAGDLVLRQVATVFADNIRRGDLAARFGGEEFVIVLPDCDKSRAIEVGEALRKAIACADFPQQEHQPGGKLTATFGVATFPDDATDLEQLLKRADDSLYEGKQAGKNVVVAAGCAAASGNDAAL